MARGAPARSSASGCAFTCSPSAARFRAASRSLFCHSPRPTYSTLGRTPLVTVAGMSAPAGVGVESVPTPAGNAVASTVAGVVSRMIGAVMAQCSGVGWMVGGTSVCDPATVPALAARSSLDMNVFGNSSCEASCCDAPPARDSWYSRSAIAAASHACFAAITALDSIDNIGSMSRRGDAPPLSLWLTLRPPDAVTAGTRRASYAPCDTARAGASCVPRIPRGAPHSPSSLSRAPYSTARATG